MTFRIFPGASPAPLWDASQGAMQRGSPAAYHPGRMARTGADNTSPLPATIFAIPLDKPQNPAKIYFDIYQINSTKVKSEQLP